MVWLKNIFIQTVVRQMDLSTYIGSVTLKEGCALECVMLLFSSTTLGTCTRYGYVVKKSKGVCTLHDDPPNNQMTQYRQLSPAHSTQHRDFAGRRQRSWLTTRLRNSAGRR